MGAAADCELIVEGLLGQPVNTITTLAFVVTGLLLVRQPTVRWVGIALIATGAGSFLFHGPMPRYDEWAHDVTLAWLVLVIAGLGKPWERWTQMPGLIVMAAAFALAPAIADPTAVLLTVVAVLLILSQDRSARTVVPLALLTIVAVLGRLGATGGPLCDPNSIFQPHALWHVAAAVAVTWWAMGYASSQ